MDLLPMLSAVFSGVTMLGVAALAFRAGALAREQQQHGTQIQDHEARIRVVEHRQQRVALSEFGG